MGYLELLESVSRNTKIKDYSDKEEIALDLIPNISLAEFRKRNMGVPVYSKHLKEKVWFCSNDKIANQIKNDDIYSVTYTVDELVNILHLQTDIQSLKSIHDAKKCFRNSEVVK